MLHQLSVKMSKHIVRHASNLEASQTDTIRYAIETLLGEISKFFLLWFFYYKMNLSAPFIFSFSIFSCIRLVAGGFHFSNYYTCLFGSFIMYTTILYLHQFFTLQSYGIFLLITTSLIILYIFTPIIPLNRYDYNKNSIPLKRFMTAILTLLLYVFALYAGQIKLFTLSLIVFSLQLLIGGIRYERLL